MDPRSAYTTDEVHIIDVREPSEWEAGHIDRAQHIPMSEIQRRIDDIPDDRSVVTVCRSGSRSGRVARFLAARGFDVENLDGGMKAWAKAGLPVVAPDGRPGKVV